VSGLSPADLLTGIFIETFRAVAEAAPFVLVGLVAAGLLHGFLDTSRIVAALGGREVPSILAATFLGAPLPLCSCGVLPAALSLRRKGASREATVAFLITTPETGVDSIALTYGLLGPFMAVARPLAAIATGMAAGLLSLVQPPTSEGVDAGEVRPAAADLHGHDAKTAARPLRLRLADAVRYAFGPLLDDLAFWLLVAFLLTGLLAGVLPGDFFARFLPPGIPSLAVMALLGIPIYVCASASTPIAAAMIAKGLSPGAALVFMLTGPATNASTIAIVARLFGRRFLGTYLAAIFGMAIAAGLVVNLILGPSWMPSPALAPEGPDVWVPVKLASVVVLVLLMGRSLLRTGLRPGLREVGGHFTALAEWVRGIRWRSPAWRPVLRAAIVLGILVWSSRGIVLLGPGEEGVVRVFGRVSGKALQPGVHLSWPPPIGRVGVTATRAVRTVAIGYMALPPEPVSTAVRSSFPPSYPPVLLGFGGPRTNRIPEGSLFVTGDETLVAVAALLEYEIADAARYQLGIDHPDALLRSAARTVLVDAIGRTPIDALYSNARGAVEKDALAKLRQSPTVEAIGVRPRALSLLYVHAPDEVHAAFRDVASAAEDRTTIRNQALVEAEGSVRLARGEAARQVSEAESYRVQQVEGARGNAAGFVPLASEDHRAGAALRTRLYLETMERALSKRAKLVTPGPARTPGLELWVTPAGGEGGAGFAPSPPFPMEDEGGGFVPRPKPSPGR
jgi:hypothetical protein